MRILFLNPPFLPRFSRSQRSPAVTRSGTLYYPIWLAYAAGAAEQAGYEVKLLDAAADGLSHERTYEIAAKFAPRLAVIDTSTPSIHNDAETAAHIKKILPDCYTVLVGAHVSALPQESLALNPAVDAVACGEYDNTILELAAALRTDSCVPGRIPGLTCRGADKTPRAPDRPFIGDLDKLPFVSRIYKKHLTIGNYFFAASLYPEVQILTARGCPFKCFFCLWPQAFQTRAYRARSPRSVVEEFLYIKNELPRVKGVVIEDDTFTVDKKRVHEICELLIRKKAVLPWNANVRTDIDLETMKLMKRAGCYLLITGIESATQAILDNINKGLKSADIQKFFDNAKRLGILVHAAFMAGNPGETALTLKKNLDLAKRFLPDTVQFFPLTPYPGTHAYHWARDNGYLKLASFRDYLSKEGLHNCVIDLPGLSSKELLAWCDRSRRAFYLNPGYILYKLTQALTRPRQFIRTYKAFMHFRKHLLRQQRRPGKA